jgi:hypothetical protein
MPNSLSSRPQLFFLAIEILRVPSPGFDGAGARDGEECV